MGMPRNLRAALLYSRMGWSVFPLRHKSKVPLSQHGFHDATTLEPQIRAWWQDAPTAGVGVATGLASNMVVLDVDPRHDGDKSLRDLESEFGAIPKTVEVITGGGGRHFYFTHPGGFAIPCAAKLRDGIDVKADGGYVAAPATVHPSGEAYQFKVGYDPGDVPLAPCPEWLLAMLRDRRERLGESQRTFLDKLGGADRVYPEGDRNNALASLVGTMHRRNMSVEAILAAALKENELKCKPPLPETEVVAIVNSITGRYEPGESLGVPDGDGPQGLLELMDVAALVSKPPEPVDWVIPGRVARGDCALLVGPPGLGKSWLTYDIAVAGAAGKDIWGTFEPVADMRVVIVDEENPSDEIHRRVRALATGNGIRPDMLVDRFVLPRPCQGFSFRDSDKVLALARLIEKVQPTVIVLDSMTAVSDVKEENDAVAVRRFFHDRLYPLRSISNAAIIVVHHTNKQAYSLQAQISVEGQTRGSIDFNAAADAVLTLVRGDEPGRMRLVQAKVRRGSKPPDLELQLVDCVNGGVRPMATVELQGDHVTIAGTILMILGSSPGPMNGPELRGWVEAQLVREVAERTFYRHLQRLQQEGRVLVTGGQKHHTQSRYTLSPRERVRISALLQEGGALEPADLVEPEEEATPDVPEAEE